MGGPEARPRVTSGWLLRQVLTMLWMFAVAIAIVPAPSVVAGPESIPTWRFLPSTLRVVVEGTDLWIVTHAPRSYPFLSGEGGATLRVFRYRLGDAAGGEARAPFPPRVVVATKELKRTLPGFPFYIEDIFPERFTARWIAPGIRVKGDTLYVGNDAYPFPRPTVDEFWKHRRFLGHYLPSVAVEEAGFPPEYGAPYLDEDRRHIRGVWAESHKSGLLGPHAILGRKVYFGILGGFAEGVGTLGGIAEFDLTRKSWRKLHHPFLVHCQVQTLTAHNGKLFMGGPDPAEYGATTGPGLVVFDPARNRWEAWSRENGLITGNIPVWLGTDKEWLIAATEYGVSLLGPDGPIHLFWEVQYDKGRLTHSLARETVPGGKARQSKAFARLGVEYVSHVHIRDPHFRSVALKAVGLSGDVLSAHPESFVNIIWEKPLWPFLARRLDEQRCRDFRPEQFSRPIEGDLLRFLQQNLKDPACRKVLRNPKLRVETVSIRKIAHRNEEEIWRREFDLGQTCHLSWFPKSHGAAPVLLYFHDRFSGLQDGDRENIKFFGDEGFAVLAPQLSSTRWHLAYQATLDLMQQLRVKSAIAVGMGTGGNVLFAHESSLDPVKGIASSYAVYSLYDFWKHLRGTRRHLDTDMSQFYLNVDWKEKLYDPLSYFRINPLQYALHHRTPLLLIHGDQDTVVPAANAVRFHKKLLEYGRKSELLLLPGSGHGFMQDPADPAKREALKRIAVFARQHLKPTATPPRASEPFP